MLFNVYKSLFNLISYKLIINWNNLFFLWNGIIIIYRGGKKSCFNKKRKEGKRILINRGCQPVRNMHPPPPFNTILFSWGGIFSLLVAQYVADDTLQIFQLNGVLLEYTPRDEGIGA